MVTHSSQDDEAVVSGDGIVAPPSTSDEAEASTSSTSEHHPFSPSPLQIESNPTTRKKPFRPDGNDRKQARAPRKLNDTHRLRSLFHNY